MPSIVQSLLAQLSGPALERIAKQIGVSPQTAQAAIAVALPLLIQSLSNNVANGQGASSLLSALDRNHDGSVLDDLMGFVSGGHATAGGADILGHIFGGQQANVAQGLGQSVGLDTASSGKLLAILAPLVMAQLGRKKQTAGFDAAGLAGVLFGEQKSLRDQAPSAMDMLSGLLASARSGTPAASNNAAAGSDLASMGASLLGQLLKPR
ncbi:MAG: DUF937 domain-containing protein [Vicinamibacteria bacterium]